MKLSKKLANQISKDINSLLCYKTMVENASCKEDYKKMRKCMDWFNVAADKLIAAGIPVIKYGE